jgi:glyoxylase-like metal-dependent hydrolase (beta-lactamase superfamily II)/ferredoxin
MARRADAHPGNAPGPFFVDRSCIDCGTCYTFAPETYADAGDHSVVARQPGTEAERLRAAMALVACPTSSIGTDDRANLAKAARAFPHALEDEVHFCGYTSEKSFGAWSWFIRREAGNVLVDSPRTAGPLVANLASLGGLRWMVLSHRDDIADHAAFRTRFGCERVIHSDEGVRGMEREIQGQDPVALDVDLLLVPTPGHTRGSQCLLYRETFLFTGDHLWWNPAKGRLSAGRSVCWHDWEAQLASLERLLDFRFRWVLPGHGAPRAFKDAGEARAELGRALDALRKL